MSSIRPAANHVIYKNIGIQGDFMSYNKAGGAVPDMAGRRKGKGNGPEMFSGTGA